MEKCGKYSHPVEMWRNKEKDIGKEPIDNKVLFFIRIKKRGGRKKTNNVKMHFGRNYFLEVSITKISRMRVRRRRKSTRMNTIARKIKRRRTTSQPPIHPLPLHELKKSREISLEKNEV